MSEMQTLWLGVTVLIVLSLAALVPALLGDSAPAGAPASQEDTLRRLYQAQLQELERERAAGRLSTEGHSQAVDELQTRLLAELQQQRPAGTAHRHSVWWPRGTALALAVLLPVGALLVYNQVGDPQAMARLAQMREMGMGGGMGNHVAQESQVQAMVGGLEAKLKAQPQNLPGWLMLARSYETMERFDEAAQAYQSALQEAQRTEQDLALQAQLLADQADALASAAGGQLDGAAGKAIEQALKLNPQQPKALALAGSAAVRRGDIDSARRHWQALLAQLDPGSDMAMRVQDDLIKLDTMAERVAR